jgi:hypothetical protein
MAGPFRRLYIRHSELRVLVTPCTLSHYATGQDYFFFGAEFRSLRFTRTRTTFCIIAIERPRHGHVIVDTPVPVLGNNTISLLGGIES